jgi:hypothetical protein
VDTSNNRLCSAIAATRSARIAIRSARLGLEGLRAATAVAAATRDAAALIAPPR